MSANTPFDTIAHTYDDDFSRSIIGHLQREQVWKITEQILPSDQPLSVLEINCGTGIDALWLASKGHQVIATDQSQEMLNHTTSTENVQFIKAAFSDLHSLFQGQQFDVIFSNFAGLNCVDSTELKKLNNNFAQLLKPKGLFIAILLGKYCWQEQLFFWLKGDKIKMKRRLEEAEARLTEDIYQTTYCYDSSQISTLFSNFEITKKKSVGIIIPPSYLEPLVKKVAFLIPLLRLLEKALSVFPFLADRGDHIYIAMKRTV